MTLYSILISIVIAGILGLLVRTRFRNPLLLGLSALAVFTFQPALPVRGLDFWLPILTLGISVMAWIITTPRERRSWRVNWLAAVILAGIVVALGLTRSLGISIPLTASRPPQFVQIVIVLGGIVLFALFLSRYVQPAKIILTSAFIFIILLFIVLKVPALAVLVSAGLRKLDHQSASLASALDVRWLGFFYIAFRILHTIRDRQNGRLPAVSLAEYIIYIIFFPALAAGPIDRIERFTGDLRSPLPVTTVDLGEAGKRLMIGLFKKFVVADALALAALNATNAIQVHKAGWAWLILYAYAFQIYFDFSGYTDIAIGMSRLMGFRLPENFKSPYLKPNLTQFWNNWHITLTQWFRTYFFNPVTRALRTAKKQLPLPAIILITQIGTMLLIGLWHGVTWNFVLWGLWHGVGLFIHNRWSDLTRLRFAKLSPRWQKLLNAGGVLLTFNFVTVGWVFFALPQPGISFHFLRVLTGLG